MAELALLEPLFVGESEEEQLFAIFRMKGSFSEEEEREWKKRVPFDGKMIEEMRGFKKTDVWSKIKMKGKK